MNGLPTDHERIMNGSTVRYLLINAKMTWERKMKLALGALYEDI